MKKETYELLMSCRLSLKDEITAADKLESPLREEELQKHYDKAISENNSNIVRAIEVARLLNMEIDEKVLKKALDQCLGIIRNGYSSVSISGAEAIASYQKRKLTNKELERILKVLIHQGNFEKALEISHRIGRKLSDEELQLFIKENDTGNNIKVLEYMENIKEEDVLNIMDHVINCSNPTVKLSQAERLANLLGRKVSVEELSQMLCVAKRETYMTSHGAVWDSLEAELCKLLIERG